MTGIRTVFITNDPFQIETACEAGVDRIMIDLEILGKKERQQGRDTLISGHIMEDLRIARSIVPRGRLQVRSNPLHDATGNEIERILSEEPDYLMVPMVRTAAEYYEYEGYVDERIPLILLAETSTVVLHLEELLASGKVDELFVGLNDMHLEFKLSFMFQLLSGGIVDMISQMSSRHHVPFGFGGVARIGTGTFPAEYIVSEHARVGSSMVILSRDFKNIFNNGTPGEQRNQFQIEHKKIKDMYNQCSNSIPALLQETQSAVRKIVTEISN